MILKTVPTRLIRTLSFVYPDQTGARDQDEFTIYSHKVHSAALLVAWLRHANCLGWPTRPTCLFKNVGTGASYLNHSQVHQCLSNMSSNHWQVWKSSLNALRRARVSGCCAPTYMPTPCQKPNRSQMRLKRIYTSLALTLPSLPRKQINPIKAPETALCPI